MIKGNPRLFRIGQDDIRVLIKELVDAFFTAAAAIVFIFSHMHG